MKKLNILVLCLGLLGVSYLSLSADQTRARVSNKTSKTIEVTIDNGETKWARIASGKDVDLGLFVASGNLGLKVKVLKENGRVIRKEVKDTTKARGKVKKGSENKKMKIFDERVSFPSVWWDIVVNESIDDDGHPVYSVNY